MEFLRRVAAYWRSRSRGSSENPLQPGHLSLIPTWVCLKIMYPIVPNGFHDHYPVFKWLFHWEYTQHFQTNPHLSSVIPKVVLYFPMLLEMFCKFTFLDVAVFCSSFAWFLSLESLNSPCLQLKSIESHEGLNVLQVLCFLNVIVLKTTYVRSILPCRGCDCRFALATCFF